jgi:hypothetical protein
MRANLGSAFLMILVLFASSALLGQELATSSEPTVASDQTTLDFSSSKASSGSTVLLASADVSPMAYPEPTMAAAPILATPIVPEKKADANLKAQARNKKIWYSLSVVNHTAATFDAWSTRSSIQRGAQELNPMLKPFASSNALYATIQVAPFGMDYLGRRMMRSHNSVVRKMWWLPQTASAAISFAAGIHNMGVNAD